MANLLDLVDKLIGDVLQGNVYNNQDTYLRHIKQMQSPNPSFNTYPGEDGQPQPYPVPSPFVHGAPLTSPDPSSLPRVPGAPLGQPVPAPIPRGPNDPLVAPYPVPIPRPGHGPTPRDPRNPPYPFGNGPLNVTKARSYNSN